MRPSHGHANYLISLGLAEVNSVENVELKEIVVQRGDHVVYQYTKIKMWGMWSCRPRHERLGKLVQNSI